MTRLLCRLGWHDWTAWTPGRISRRRQWVAGQRRTCVHCLVTQVREL